MQWNMVMHNQKVWKSQYFKDKQMNTWQSEPNWKPYWQAHSKLLLNSNSNHTFSVKCIFIWTLIESVNGMILIVVIVNLTLLCTSTQTIRIWIRMENFLPFECLHASNILPIYFRSHNKRTFFLLVKRYMNVFT